MAHNVVMNPSDQKRLTFWPRELSPGQIYDLMAGLIVPRPIAFVSTVGASGIRNLAPFSYFMPGGIQPPSLCFCTVLGRDGAKKDSLRNIEETGEFVVNLVHRAMAEGMNQTGVDYPYAFDEWEVSGLTAIPSVAVKPERVAESLVQFECVLAGLLPHGTQSGGSVYVAGEIKAIHTVFPIPESGQFQPVARLAGSGYLDLDGGKLFEMARPKPPAESS